MARKQTEEIIQRINMDTRRRSDGQFTTKATLFFKSGLQYAVSCLGLEGQFESLCIGDKVLVTISGNTVVQVL